MSRIFYRNDELGKCQCIALKQLSESSNLNFDEYIEIVDRRLKTFLNMSFETIFKSMSSDWGFDMGDLMRKLWNESKKWTINELYDYVKGGIVDGLLAVSIVLQYFSSAICGANIYEWRCKSLSTIQRIEHHHIQNIESYIKEMSKYTQNVAIVCYLVWVNGHYDRETGKYVNDNFIDYLKRARRRPDTPLEKDKIAHVYITFYDVKRNIFLNYNSNLRYEIKVAGFVRVFEYVWFEGRINHHGSRIYEILRFWGGGGGGGGDNLFTMLMLMLTLIVTVVVIACVIHHVSKANNEFARVKNT